jgi:hypothetical protein
VCRRSSQHSAGLCAVLLACIALGALSCSEEGTEPKDAGLSDLTVQVLEGYISANLQPIVPPDPIVCYLRLRLVNSNSTSPLTGLSIPSAVVFRADNSIQLGVIQFESYWNGSIGAGAADTVIVNKIEEDHEIFAPPCGEKVYLRVSVAKSAVLFKQITTPAYYFACPVIVEKDG